VSADAPPSRRLTTRLTIIVFVVLFGLLALGYFMFLRPGYVAVFSQMRPAEASAIVAQLEAKKIPYRLSDGGTTILVPDDQADTARLAIGGSDVPIKGGVGFELFNKSDMGLTDFAQRINYQRALQGELERSIMMIDEVDTARVHLALPERTIFRSERSSAKAAVELVAKPGKVFDEPRVLGIQRLVAFAVPDLSATDVVVLDGNGRVLSQSDDQETFLSPDAEEQRSTQSYYRARARAALQQALPGVRADVTVIALGGYSNPPGAAASEVAPASTALDAHPAAKSARNFRLRVIVATGAPLNAEETTLARNAVVAAMALDEAAGDELSFQVGIVPGIAAPAPASLPQASLAPDQSSVLPQEAGTARSYWFAGGLLLLMGLGLLLSRARQRTRLSAAERDAMVERVRAALRQPASSHADA
jgi:flagellar M-ring protein FliF